MATKETKTEEVKDLTGLSVASNVKSSELDLTTALLRAADFRNDEAEITEVEIRREVPDGKGGYEKQTLFTLHIRPLSDGESRAARKKATTYMKNPNGKNLPPIEKELNSAMFHNYLIYTATTKEDQQNIWSNKAVMDKYDILNPAETVDILLKVGEKTKLVETIMDISGMMEDEEIATPEDYAKN